MVQAHIQAAGHLLPTSQTKELGCVCLQALQDTNPLWWHNDILMWTMIWNETLLNWFKLDKRRVTRRLYHLPSFAGFYIGLQSIPTTNG